MLIRRPSLRDERGFTLVEMLITVAILGIIIVPLANALIGFFRNSADTTGRLSESHDVQIAAAYFAQDVQSVGVHDWKTSGFPLKQSVETNVTGTAGVNPCGTSSTPAVIRLAWDDPTAAVGEPPTAVASYYVQTVGGESQLHRKLCKGSGATLPGPARQEPLSHRRRITRSVR